MREDFYDNTWLCEHCFVTEAGWVNEQELNWGRGAQMFGFAPVQPVVPVGLSAGDSWGGWGMAGGFWHTAMSPLPKLFPPNTQSLPETSTPGHICGTVLAVQWHLHLKAPGVLPGEGDQ